MPLDKYPTVKNFLKKELLAVTVHTLPSNNKDIYWAKHGGSKKLTPLHTLAKVTRRYNTQFNVYCQFSSHHPNTQ
jgi:hypothetical protein